MEAALAHRPPLSRRSQRDRRREAETRILTAAARLIADRSLDAWTLADAAEAAGYSRGLPAHYFGSKDRLVAAVADHIVQAFARRLARRRPQTPGLAGLVATVRGYLEIAASSPDQARAFNVVLGGALERPALALAVARLNASATESLEADIRAASAPGRGAADADAAALAALVLSALRGAVACWLMDPAGIDLKAVADELVAQLAGRLGADSRAGARTGERS